MSDWDQNGHRTGEGEPLDDATVEELLSGRYAGDAADLVAVRQFFEHVRAVAERPARPPSPALAQILTESVDVDAGELSTATPPSLRDLRLVRSARRPRRPRPAIATRQDASPTHVAPVVAVVSVFVVVAVVAAGSARLLPGPTQRLVAKILRTVTPFDFPENGKSNAAVTRAPSVERPAPPDDAITGGTAEPPQRSAVGSDPENRPAGRDDPNTLSQPGGATQAPTPSATLPSRAAPAAPEAEGRPSDALAGSDRPPPVKRNGLTADLSGATGVETAGDADGHGRAVLDVNPGRDELCLTLVVSGVAPVSAAHLHGEVIGASGPVVAAFAEPTATRTCITVTDQLIKRIRKEPGNFYVDVHTTEFPNGALRGQLTK